MINERRLILGIETSCDETAVALVEGLVDGLALRILSSVVFSQIKLHKKTGGVVPEVAAREHAVKIIPVLRECLAQAKIKLEQIDGIAVTTGPGLLSSLLIGVNAAAAIAWILKKPLIPINHIEGHIYANMADSRLPASRQPKFPIAVLTASGGHNELILWKGHGKYKILGETLDDAAGEAFDKVGKLLSLPYPGGPAIEKIAKKGKAEKFPLPLPYPKKNFNFSFSGIKTAVLYLLRDLSLRNRKAQQSLSDISEQTKADIAASFQQSVCEVLAEKLVNAAKKFKTKEIHVAGGVSANRFLINLVRKKIRREKLHAKFRHPPLFLCTDNAAMIAAAGFYKLRAEGEARRSNLSLILPDPNLPIRNW